MGARAIGQNIELERSNGKPADLIDSIRQNSHTKLRTVRCALVILDAAVVGLAFLLAYNIRFNSAIAMVFDPTADQNIPFYSQYVYLLIPLWILLFAAFRLYDPAVLFGGLQEYMSAFNACTVGIMLVILASFLDPSLIFARGWLLVAWG